MPNELQRIMNSLSKGIPLTNCYIDDIIIASEGTMSEHKATVEKNSGYTGQKQYSRELGELRIFPERDRMARVQNFRSGGLDHWSEKLML